VPHNCGQLNGTVACNAVITGCNVCGTCCIWQQNVTQDVCDACFNDPSGCNGTAALPLLR
jgi:hypothetical protein